jgi:hypothetical protein
LEIPARLASGARTPTKAKTLAQDVSAHTPYRWCHFSEGGYRDTVSREMNVMPNERRLDYSGSRDGVSRSRGPSAVATNRERRPRTIPRRYSFLRTALKPWVPLRRRQKAAMSLGMLQTLWKLMINVVTAAVAGGSIGAIISPAAAIYRDSRRGGPPERPCRAGLTPTYDPLR